MSKSPLMDDGTTHSDSDSSFPVASPALPEPGTPQSVRNSSSRSNVPASSGAASHSHSNAKVTINGCVRWCMNVALQSFDGEPWAVALRPCETAGPPSHATSMAAATATSELPRRYTTTTATSRLANENHSAAHTSGGALHNSASSHPAEDGSFSGSNSAAGSLPPLEKSRNGFLGATRIGAGPATASRSGMRLVPLEYEQGEEGSSTTAPLGGIPTEAYQEDLQELHHCVQAVNEPIITYGSDELLGRFTNVHFVPEGGGSERERHGAEAAGTPLHYRLATSIEPMLMTTLQPAVSAVVDHCVSAVVLVYGATQEMKQMGLIGTPEECGLLPQGIRMVMERYLERRRQQTAGRRNKKAAGCSTSTTTASPGGGASSSPPLPGTGDVVDDRSSAEDTEERQSHCTTSTCGGSTFVLPHIGSSNHRFTRVEASFIAFNATSVVDLLDLPNKRVELVLNLAPPPTPSAFEDSTSEDTPRGNTSTTDTFVVNARALPAESTNDAFSALDIGLENLSRALDMELLLSESSSSLLFSLTAYTDNCRCATFNLLCLAEDPACQNWLVSTVHARSQAIPLGEEQSWASIQNTPMPPPLHHHAATLLVPILCFGNMFTSVLACMYNSSTALSRLNRDLTFAVTGYRMRTIPRVTAASSRRSPRPLPAGWEEHFTNEGRRYFTDTTSRSTTWEDPRFTLRSSSSRRSSRRSSSNHAHRTSRISLGNDDHDFLATKLHALGTPSLGASSPPQSPEAPDIGIVVVDTQCRPRVVLNTQNADFVRQYAKEQEALRDKQQRAMAQRAALARLGERSTASSSAPSGAGGADAALPQQTGPAPQEAAPMSAAQREAQSPDATAVSARKAAADIQRKTSPKEDKPSVPSTESIQDTIRTTQFYACVQQEQVALPPRESRGTSVSSGACSPPSTPLPSPTASATVPPETQELESLVEEFHFFFTEAYAAKEKVRELEAALAAQAPGTQPRGLSSMNAQDLAELRAVVQRCGGQGVVQTMLSDAMGQAKARGAGAKDMWQQIVVSLSELEQRIASHYRRRYECRVETLAVKQQALLQRAGQAYEDEIASLQAENAALRGQLSCAQVRTTPQRSTPTLQQLLDEQAEIFNDGTETEK